MTTTCFNTTDSFQLEGMALLFRCRCGKGYRTTAGNAGRSLRCRGCQRRLRVPGETRQERSVSGRTRAQILVELGIDPQAAEDAFWRRQLESFEGEAPQPTPLHEEPLEPAQVEHTPRPARVATRAPRERTLGRTLRYGAFFAAGITGFLYHVAQAPLAWAAVGALLLALIGVYEVQRASRRAPVLA